MLIAQAEDVTFLVLTGDVIALKATLESRLHTTLLAELGCGRPTRRWYIRLWVHLRAFNGEEHEHIEEFQVSSQEYGSKVLKNIYKQFRGSNCTERVNEHPDYEDEEDYENDAEYQDEEQLIGNPDGIKIVTASHLEDTTPMMECHDDEIEVSETLKED